MRSSVSLQRKLAATLLLLAAIPIYILWMLVEHLRNWGSEVWAELKAVYRDWRNF